eukprot:2633292-Pyramimonas_sp.AAC.1
MFLEGASDRFSVSQGTVNTQCSRVCGEVDAFLHHPSDKIRSATWLRSLAFVKVQYTSQHAAYMIDIVAVRIAGTFPSKRGKAPVILIATIAIILVGRVLRGIFDCYGAGGISHVAELVSSALSAEPSGEYAVKWMPSSVHPP